MDIQSTTKLNTGKKIPLLGLGVYLSEPGEETRKACDYALEIGYRHIDTAAFYQNEHDVGESVRSSAIKREEVFITTKLWNKDQGYDSALKAFDKSLAKLKLDYVDLYLIHWPVEGIRHDSWRALERIYQSGGAKAIGVSNYTIRHLEELLARTPIVPAVNQVEFSVYLYQKELLDFCSKNGIILESYTPLTRGKRLKDPKLVKTAEKYGKTPAQILIRWALQAGTVVLPKSVHFERIKQNADVFDFEISKEDMVLLATFNENYRVAWDPSNIK